MTDRSAYTIEATGTSLAILEALVERGEPTGVTALAERVDVSKSVAHNHLSTLCAHGFALKRDGGYCPSLRTLDLGDRTRRALPTYRAAKPKVDNLAAASGETTMLFVLEGQSGVPAYIVEPADGWTPTFRLGERLPLPVTAAGKAILASLPDDRVREILSGTDLVAHTDATVTDPEALRAQLGRIRDDGVAFCRGERDAGVVGVAAPIEIGSVHTVAALGVCGPVDRLNGRYLEEDIPGQVLSTSQSIQVALTSR